MSNHGVPLMIDGDGLGEPLDEWIDRLRTGDQRARDELLNRASAKLRVLTRRMLKDYRPLERWEQSEDVCQNASIRLWRALKSISPPTLADFFRLAAWQIRRELIDLGRHYYGPEGLGANHASNLGGQPSAHEAGDSTWQPDRVAAWTDFHRRVDALPEDERLTFDLLWYQGLTNAQAALVLGISAPTLRKRWRAARLKLGKALDDGLTV